jgi:multiple sugar transport system permease protein
MRFPGKKGFMQFIIITQMFAPVVLLVGIYRVMLTFHLTNSLFGLIVLIAAFNQAFSSWLLSGTFATISRELEEAATINGAGFWRRIFSIVIPLAKNGFLSGFLLSFISIAKELDLIAILMTPDNYTLSFLSFEDPRLIIVLINARGKRAGNQFRF